MAYTPAYKLTPKATTATKSTQVEGIGAFISRMGRARNEADRKEDLVMQEKITRGEVSIDEQIAYNEGRMRRFSKNSTEWQTLQNNIADLEVGKKWETLNDMESREINLDKRKGFLVDWRGEVEEGSDLFNQIEDKINRYDIQIEDKAYNAALEESTTLMSRGKKSRNDHIKFLYTQLNSTTTSDLRTKIGLSINSEEETLKIETERNADQILDDLHGSGIVENEQTYLDGLNEDLQQAIDENDVLEVSRRTEDVKQAGFYITDMRSAFSFDEMELKHVKGTLSDDEKLSWYKDYLSGDDLDRVIKFGPGSGLVRNTYFQGQMERFIPKMIENKEDDLFRQWSKLTSSSGSTLEDLKREAGTIRATMDTFGARADFANYTNEIRDMKTSMDESLADQQLARLDLMSARSEIDGVGILRELDSLKNNFPDVIGKSLFRNKILLLEEDVAKDEYQKFYGEITGDIQKQRDMLAIRQSKLNILAQSRPDLVDLITQQMNEIEDGYKSIGDAESKFNLQFGQSFKDFKQFLPDLQTGQVTRPGFELPEFKPAQTIEQVGQTSQLGIRIPDVASLQRQNPEDIMEGAFGGSRFLKPGKQLIQ